jgi:hypothetical protein
MRRRITIKCEPATAIFRSLLTIICRQLSPKPAMLQFPRADIVSFGDVADGTNERMKFGAKCESSIKKFAG